MKVVTLVVSSGSFASHTSYGVKLPDDKDMPGNAEFGNVHFVFFEERHKRASMMMWTGGAEVPCVTMGLTSIGAKDAWRIVKDNLFAATEDKRILTHPDVYSILAGINSYFNLESVAAYGDDVTISLRQVGQDGGSMDGFISKDTIKKLFKDIVKYRMTKSLS